MDGKQLKNSILQWAIQGKLVPQNPKDEPAQKLLERIAAIRHSEQSEESSKRSKKTSKSPTSRIYRENGVWYEQVGNAEPKDISDEIPFNIPESWEWVRLPMVGELNRGKSQARPRNDPSLFSNGTFPMIQTGDVARAETVISSCKSKYNEKGIAQSRIWPKGTICLTIAANIGDVAILGFDACFPDSVVGFNAYTPIDSNLFFLYALKCYKNILDELSRSTAQKNINIDILSKIFFPLPPLAEQKRIVAKLEQVLPLAEEYGAAQKQLDKLNKELPEALKKSILQQAIQGKLVPQNPKDEPAQKLLERIAFCRHSEQSEESSKRSKKTTKNPTSRIYCENGTWYEQIGNSEPKDISEDIPFEIPENWTWCRWGDLSDSIQYGYNAPALEFGRIKMVRISDIHDNKIEWDNVPYCQIKEAEIPTYLLKKNDILFARTGGTVGKSYLVGDVPTEAVYAGYLIRTRYNAELLNPQYLKFFMESSLYWEQLHEGTIATAQPNCNGKTLSKMLLPLPPLAEQKRIVTKLEQLFKVL